LASGEGSNTRAFVRPALKPSTGWSTRRYPYDTAADRLSSTTNVDRRASADVLDREHKPTFVHRHASRCLADLTDP